MLNGTKIEEGRAVCYIIYSKSIDRYYIGVTQCSFADRLERHNSKHYGDTHYTAVSSDWVSYLIIEARDNKQAFRLEKKNS